MQCLSFAARCQLIAPLIVAAFIAGHGFGQEDDIRPVPEAQSIQDTPEEDKADKPKREPIYDEEANAEEQIELALARAKKEHKRVLIQWGANWCGWCFLLHDTMQEVGSIRNKLRDEYEVVLVDIGKLDKHLELIEKYEAKLKTEGVPYLTVLDASGQVVTNQETASLESKEEGKKEHVPEVVLEFLTKHQSPPADATAVLEGGIAQAKTDGKLVFLHFGAPWCGWCHHLENWMAEPDNHQLLSRVFVDVKVDTDRMTSGQETLKKYCKESAGIPWFVFLDGEGQAVVDSNGPGGNVGFPSTDEEIGYFASMLTKTDKFTAAEIEQLRASLVENRKQREDKRREAEPAKPAAGAVKPIE